MKILGLVTVLGAAAVVTAACASTPYGGEARSPALLSIAPPPGFEMRDSVVLVDARGLRAHGRLCRIAPVQPWPSQIKMALISDTGAPVSDKVANLGPRSTRQSGCVVYNVPTSWTLQSGQSLRLSAS